MSETRTRSLVVFAIILTAACARLFQFVPNMAPITALAVFGAFSFGSRRLAFVVPMLAMVLGDLGLALLRNDFGYAWHDTQWVVYASFALISLLSMQVSSRMTVTRVAISTLGGSVLFFITTNLAVWASTGMYAHTLSGLIQCYTMALPFFRNSLIADVSYATIMFGALALVYRKSAKSSPALVNI